MPANCDPVIVYAYTHEPPLVKVLLLKVRTPFGDGWQGLVIARQEGESRPQAVARGLTERGITPPETAQALDPEVVYEPGTDRVCTRAVFAADLRGARTPRLGGPVLDFEWLKTDEALERLDVRATRRSVEEIAAVLQDAGEFPRSRAVSLTEA